MSSRVRGGSFSGASRGLWGGGGPSRRDSKAEAVSGTSLSEARARRAGGAGFPKRGVLTRQQSRQRAASRERPLLAAAARRAKAAGKRRVRVRV